jgi:hypothetical protein
LQIPGSLGADCKSAPAMQISTRNKLNCVGLQIPGSSGMVLNHKFRY